MRRSTILLFNLLLIITLKSVAQQEIKGTIYDKSTRSPLTGASIIMYTADNSIAKARATTNDQGKFVITNPPAGNYNLIISYIGYKPERIPISVTNKVKTYSLDLKHTGLLPNSIKLSTIDIKANKPLITIRKDTIEFSASNFYTAENASLKNLLQKIPGLMVDQDGNFYFQGKKINDLYIDGRPAFSKSANSSGDPKELSQLLQANVVDKIQLADKRGPDGLPKAGNEEKVINITVKKEDKKGINGKMGTGYGTKDTYAASASANMFRNNKMIIGAAAAQNNNTITSSVGDKEEFLFIPLSLTGLTTYKFVRGSGSFQLSADSKLNTNIAATDNYNEVFSQTDRTNILPDSTFHYTSSNAKTTDAKLISYGISSENKLSESAMLNLSIYGSFNKNNNESLNTFSTTGSGLTDTINKGQTVNSVAANKNDYTFKGSFIKSFKKPGRLLFLDLAVNHRGDVEDQHNFTLNEIKQSLTADTINQQIHIKTTNNDIIFNPNYKEPLSNSLALNLNYVFSNSLTRNEQYAYDFDYYKMEYSRQDDMLTYIFKNNYLGHYFGSGLTYDKGKLFATLSLTYNLNKSTSTNYTNNKTVEQTVNYWTPGLDLTYKINNFSTLIFGATRTTHIPKMESLIPVVSTLNPLYITLGNPDLKPSVHNSLHLNYSSFNAKGTSSGFAVYADFETAGLGNSVISDSIGRQITKPVNVTGNFNIRSNLNIGKRFNKAGLSINYSLSPTINRNSNYINYQKNSTTVYEIAQQLTTSWNHKKDMEVSLMARWNYNGNKYAVQNSYIDFLQYTFIANLNTYLPLGINIGAIYMYSHNTSQNESNQLLNAWIAKTWLADKSLQTKFSCFDILRQYKSFSTTQNYLYIEQVNSNILTQYFMGSVTWYFGKKKKL